MKAAPTLILLEDISIEIIYKAIYVLKLVLTGFLFHEKILSGS